MAEFQQIMGISRGKQVVKSLLEKHLDRLDPLCFRNTEYRASGNILQKGAVCTPH